MLKKFFTMFIILIFSSTILLANNNFSLYYGKIEKVINDDNGKVKSLLLNSENKGEYIFHLSEETICIDSGRKIPAPTNNFGTDERVYVFHSNIATTSLPPQSPALVIMRDIPQDTMCGQYHIIENIIQEEDGIKLLTNNGNLYIKTDEETKIFPYKTRNIVTINDIKVGSKIIAWYYPYATVIPGNTYATHIMLLPQ